MDLGLDRKVALVLGASKGIGFDIAAALRAEGATVAVASRSRERIESAAEALGAVPFVHDSDAPESVEALVRAVEQTVGSIDVLVLNTGGPPVHDDPLGVPVAHWEAAHRSLLLTPLALLRCVVPGMQERGWGRVISIASTAVREPMFELVLSGAYRSALASTLKVYSQALGSSGVTINTVLPGDIATDRLLDSFPSLAAAAEEAAESIPVGRLGLPGELAAVAAFLCSEQAAFVTGGMIAVDGGRSAAL